MTKTLVSVVVATYRRELELQRALASVAAQDYSCFEIIVVDDNDDAAWNKKVDRVIEQFTAEFSDIRLKYIRNSPNLGSAKSRNAGIEAASGDYVCFLDDDDIYLPERISTQLDAMIKADADYGVTDLMLYSEKDSLIEVRTRKYIEDTSSDKLLKYHLMYHITGTDTMMFKRQYLCDIGMFSPIDVGDEFYLMKKAIENGGRFIYTPVCFVKAYVHTGDGGLSSGESKLKGEMQLYDFKKNFFDRLDRASVRYIKMRHHAVMAFAYLRIKRFGSFAIEAFKAFIVSPIGCISLLRDLK